MLTVLYRIIVIVQNVKKILKKNAEDNISAIAGNSAFFMMLSLVPFLLFVFSVVSIAGVPKNVFNDYMRENFNVDFVGRFTGYVDIVYGASAGLAVTTILVTLWSAGKGVYAVSEGIKVIYKFKGSENWLTKRIKATLYTFLLFLIMVLLMGIIILQGLFDDLISDALGKFSDVLSFIYYFKYVLVFILSVLVINLMMFLILHKDNKEKRYVGFMCLLPGSVLTALCWVLLTFGFQIYVNVFNGFDIYGSLAAIVVFMLWMYFLMYIMLLCAQLNYIYKKEIYMFGARLFISLKKRKKTRKKS